MTDVPRSLESPRQLLELTGETLGTSRWRLIDQQLVNEFARVTEDEQWIHIDQEAAAAGPFGGTIAHGYLTLSLCSAMVGEAVSVNGAGMVINYGLDRVRFPAPAMVGTRIRAHVNVKEATERSSGIQGVFEVVIEREGEEKPACVAELVFRYVLSSASQT